MIKKPMNIHPGKTLMSKKVLTFSKPEKERKKEEMKEKISKNGNKEQETYTSRDFLLKQYTALTRPLAGSCFYFSISKLSHRAWQTSCQVSTEDSEHHLLYYVCSVRG